MFEGEGLHLYRQGRYAKFLERIIRNMILPRIEKELTKGKTFLSTLTGDELQFVMERTVLNRAAAAQLEAVLSGQIPEDIEILKQREQQNFMQKGNQHVLEILKDEFKDIHLKVKINIAGKQKDMSMMVDKLTNVVRQYLSTPQMQQDPFALKLIQRIMEASGFPIEDFPVTPMIATMQQQQQLQQGVSQAGTNPLKGFVPAQQRQAITT